MVYRIDNASASATPPAAGTPGAEGFPTNGVPGTTPPTVGDAYWFYSIGEELRNIAVAAGLTPTKSDVAQVLQGVKRMFGGNFSLVTATATLTADNSGLIELGGSAAFTIELPSPVGDFVFPRFIFCNLSSNAQTIATPAGAFYGPGAVAGSTSLLLAVGQVLMAWPDGSNWLAWTLGGQPHGQVAFESTGAFSWTVPAGVFQGEVTMTGAGGGGGDCNSTSTSGDYAGSGGGAGATCMFKVALTPGAVLSGTIGAGGGPGGAGGATIFLGVTAGGGALGTSYASSTPGGLGGSVSGSATGLIGTQVNIPGGDGDDGQNGLFFVGGNGGDSWWGGGSRSNGAGSPNPATAFGAGGGGAYNNVAGTGGNGANGIVMIKW